MTGAELADQLWFGDKMSYIKGDNFLPAESAERKAIPMTTGVLDYFPAAIAEVAKVSKAGNEKHNPGQEMHHARGKSTDHADSILRHLAERGGIDADTGVRHSAELAWRALALLQQELEDAGAPLARAAKLPPGAVPVDADTMARVAAGSLTPAEAMAKVRTLPERYTTPDGQGRTSQAAGHLRQGWTVRAANSGGSAFNHGMDGD